MFISLLTRFGETKLSDCLMCDKIYSGDVFNKEAGLNRRRMNITSDINLANTEYLFEANSLLLSRV